MYNIYMACTYNHIATAVSTTTIVTVRALRACTYSYNFQGMQASLLCASCSTLLQVAVTAPLLDMMRMIHTHNF
jgi:hypothetical protein